MQMIMIRIRGADPTYLLFPTKSARVRQSSMSTTYFHITWKCVTDLEQLVIVYISAPEQVVCQRLILVGCADYTVRER